MWLPKFLAFIGYHFFLPMVLPCARESSAIIINTIIITIIAHEQPREDARLRGDSLIEPCAIVPGAGKISNRCNIEQCNATMT